MGLAPSLLGEVGRDGILSVKRRDGICNDASRESRLCSEVRLAPAVVAGRRNESVGGSGKLLRENSLLCPELDELVVVLVFEVEEGIALKRSPSSTEDVFLIWAGTAVLWDESDIRDVRGVKRRSAAMLLSSSDCCRNNSSSEDRLLRDLVRRESTEIRRWTLELLLMIPLRP